MYEDPCEKARKPLRLLNKPKFELGYFLTETEIKDVYSIQTVYTRAILANICSRIARNKESYVKSAKSFG